MSIECDMSRVTRSRGAQCGVLLRNNEVDDGRAKPVHQSDSRSYLGDFCSFVDIYPRIGYVKIRDCRSLLCGR